MQEDSERVSLQHAVAIADTRPAEEFAKLEAELVRSEEQTIRLTSAVKGET